MDASRGFPFQWFDGLNDDHRQYSMTRPQFVREPEPVHPRDRYRNSRSYEDPTFDTIDEGMYDQDMPFDDFDRELLRQPYPDRRRQAEQGQARLTLPPLQSRHCEVETPPRPLAYYEQDVQNYLSAAAPDVPQAPARNRDLSQYAYNPSEFAETSSELHGLPSSPAFRASQRRHVNVRSVDKRSQQDPFGDPFTPPATQKASTGTTTQRPAESPNVIPNQLDLRHAPPMAQGIQLVPLSKLPDRLKVIFPFPLFNAVQSKCFHNVYNTDNNFVLSSPTGSGKTAILELAICRAINKNTTAQYKVVYQAPTKALCSERQRDWQMKFKPLGLECVEITGDSDASNLRGVQSASIIITTPEKWDSLTRKWKDHEKLMKLINLFLIDEVHTLGDNRGATLEAVVSRMKSMGSDVRFVALSATVPNLEDIAVWLGKNSAEQYEPAVSEKFGEEFRPVKLRKHVCGYPALGNDFKFDRMLDTKLLGVVAKYSERKPIMIFCFTRKSTASTAKVLSNWWATRNKSDRYWPAPKSQLQLSDDELRGCAASGVAFHHAGLSSNDRISVESAFLRGDLSVICCTSTLAVGVNLPCHFVIIKNTVSYTSDGPTEYSDLEIMQMLGRAGRPQFDVSGVAVIMTSSAKVKHYEKMVTGQQLLESSLHLNLVEHLNAEIGLGTIRSYASAKDWLKGTFLYVRLKQNFDYYKLQGSKGGLSIDDLLEDICNRDITLLQETDLVTEGTRLKCTSFGDAMARYYVQFDTMRNFMGLQPKAKISEILSALVQASEFRELRFRSGEKSFYKNLNKHPSIRFPIPVDLALPAHKTSIMLQSVLGGLSIAWNEDPNKKHRQQYTTELAIIFKHIHRMVRCIIDCELSHGDSIAARNALMLERSLGARVWDDSPLQIKQVDKLGDVSVQKLAAAGIRSLEELETTEPHRIEMVLGRNPPFGLKILDQLKLFPKPRVSLQVMPNSISKGIDGVTVKVKVEIGFMNEQPVVRYQHKTVMVSFLAETSDGRIAHFAHISGQKLGNGQDLIFPVLLTNSDQTINCYVSCDEIAGSMREASVKPKVPPALFPPPRPDVVTKPLLDRQIPNTSRRRSDHTSGKRPAAETDDEFGDDGIEDADLLQAAVADLDFDHIDNYADPNMLLTRQNTTNNSKGKARGTTTEQQQVPAPLQLDNGNYACGHRCKNKKTCAHKCCREGVGKPRKRAKTSADAENNTSQVVSTQPPWEMPKKQTKIQPFSAQRSSDNVEVLDLTGVMHTQPTYSYGEGGRPHLSFLEDDFNDIPVDDDFNISADDNFNNIPTDDFCEDVNAVTESVQPEPEPEPDFAGLTTLMDDEVAEKADSEDFGDLDDDVFADLPLGQEDMEEWVPPVDDGVESAGNAEDAAARVVSAVPVEEIPGVEEWLLKELGDIVHFT